MLPRSVRVLLAMFLFSFLAGCGGNDPEADRWVTVRIDGIPPDGNGSDAFEGNDAAVRRDMRARGVQYKDLICGVIRNNYTPPLQFPSEFPPSRVYHFLVEADQASMLIATGKYIAREGHGSALPFTAIRCGQFGLT